MWLYQYSAYQIVWLLLIRNMVLKKKIFPLIFCQLTGTADMFECISTNVHMYQVGTVVKRERGRWRPSRFLGGRWKEGGLPSDWGLRNLWNWKFGISQFHFTSFRNNLWKCCKFQTSTTYQVNYLTSGYLSRQVWHIFFSGNFASYSKEGKGQWE